MHSLPTEPNELSATEAASLIAERKLSVEELTRSCLKRIADRDEAVKAWAFLSPEMAIGKAKELDKVLIHAGTRRPLHGLPFGVKDMIDTGDMPTTNNSPIYDGHQPAQDAQVVRVMTGNGAFSLGKTDTVEFASGGRKALTRHPLDPARTPGGSSSGSGAVVGDMQVPLALGTQTDGSLIRPASFNGVYAHKPTHGTVPVPGMRHCSPTLDTLGWYGRSPDDLILVARAFRLWDIETLPEVRIEGLRVGVARTHNWTLAAPETQAAVERAAGLLADAGAAVFDLDLPSPFETLNAAQKVVMQGEGRVHFLPDYLQNHALLHQDFRNYVENANNYTPQQLLNAIDTAAACRPVFDGLFGDRLDVVLTPSAVGEAPLGPSETTGDAVMNSMWTLLHVPCINIPGASGPNRLPVGITLVGPRLGDAQLLAAAKAAAPVLDGALR